MSEIDHAEILKQMGVTQWVLRSDTDARHEAVSAQVGAAIAVARTAAPPERDIAVESTPVLVPPVTVPSIAETLDGLNIEVQNCQACSLAASRTQTVFGEGPACTDWLFIGEAPGQQEDRQGKPFVGRAGSLLTQMLLALGQARDQVFVTNTLKCRPPGNRDPQPDELAACEPFLLRQIEWLQPKVIVALGRFSAQTLLKSEQPLGRMRGQVYRYGPNDTPLIVTYHPAYLLRNPTDKSKVWQDLLLANRQLSG